MPLVGGLGGWYVVLIRWKEAQHSLPSPKEVAEGSSPKELLSLEIIG